jgi:hypothetical protein
MWNIMFQGALFVFSSIVTPHFPIQFSEFIKTTEKKLQSRTRKGLEATFCLWQIFITFSFIIILLLIFV